MSKSFEQNLEFIFLGTGTSSSVPHVDCLTAPPERDPCRTCLSTLTPQGWKNRRRNTSAVVRMKDRNGDLVTIVIDAGKTFQAAAIEWFPKHGLRKIDALLITHAHADAMNGLDDLRGWTLRGVIQDKVHAYVSRSTLQEISRSFPYLVSKQYASGGGDVPDFVWHIIEDGTPFEIGDTGIMVTPFNVEHGRIYATPPSGQNEVVPPLKPINGDSASPQVGHKEVITRDDPHSAPIAEEVITPLHCFGFRFGALVYISDVSAVPTAAWTHLRPPPAVLVLDCLRPDPHTSHFGIVQAVNHARKIGARKTLLTGFSHEVAHEEWERIMSTAEGARPGEDELSGMREVVRNAVSLVDEGQNVWIRPAFDGMKLWVEDGEVRFENA